MTGPDAGADAEEAAAFAAGVGFEADVGDCDADAGRRRAPFCPQAVRLKQARATTQQVAHKGMDTLRRLNIAELSTMPPTEPAPASAVADVMSDAEYQAATRAVLEAIESTVDRWLQDDVIDIDTQRTGGLLEMSFPAGSKIIVNTQPPLQELWLAARAGGYHFKRIGGKWLDTRSGSEFFGLLSEQASAQGGRALRFASP